MSMTLNRAMILGCPATVVVRLNAASVSWVKNSKSTSNLFNQLGLVVVERHSVQLLMTTLDNLLLKARRTDGESVIIT